ncbi:MAG TPA: tetratricopeptide repeat protein [Chloroflexi bacterium]|nr:tetratricopeptide repeat protein [Chloroflexota bacterium]
MYLEPTIQRNKKRRSSPVRVLFLLILIGIGIYVYILVNQEHVESPFVPTPTPTRTAFSYITAANDLYLQGRLTETIAAYQQAISLEPDNALPYIPLARLLILDGQIDAAIQHAQQATEIAPQHAAAWAILGMAYDWNGDISQAIETCQHAIELDPTYAEGYAYLAEAYVDAGQWAKANQTIQTALQLDDRSADVHRNHGYVLEIQGNYWQALAAYERALEINPHLAHIHLSVGRNYRRLGDLNATIASFKRAIEINPDNAQGHFELGWTYLTYLGDYNQADAALTRAVEANPQFGRAFGGLAIGYWQRRNYEDAIINFERAIHWDSADARKRARTFYVTVEDASRDGLEPSTQVVLRGDFAPLTGGNPATLQASLTPQALLDDAWTNASGQVILEPRTGAYTVTLSGLPRLEAGRVYAGWFGGVNTLSGYPVNTGPLPRTADGSVATTLETGWVRGPAIDYFYTLGLAYYFKNECDKAYPLFEAALQINPEETNALEGIRMCRQLE